MDTSKDDFNGFDDGFDSGSLDNSHSNANELEEDRVHKGSYNEKIGDKPAIERIFDTEGVLYALEKTLRGYQKMDGEWVKVRDEVARTSFINYTINSLRSLVNNVSILSAISEREAKEILLEKNLEYIHACWDEVTLDEDDTEYVINLHDTVMQIFMGILIGGHGSRVLRQVAASLYVEDNKKSDSSPFIDFSYFKDKFNKNDRSHSQAR